MRCDCRDVIVDRDRLGRVAAHKKVAADGVLAASQAITDYILKFGRVDHGDIVPDVASTVKG
jgi:hypothetical protein